MIKIKMSVFSIFLKFQTSCIEINLIKFQTSVAFNLCPEKKKSYRNRLCPKRKKKSSFDKTLKNLLALTLSYKITRKD